jgi:hypothetical protein
MISLDQFILFHCKKWREGGIIEFWVEMESVWEVFFQMISSRKVNDVDYEASIMIMVPQAQEKVERLGDWKKNF